MPKWVISLTYLVSDVTPFDPDPPKPWTDPGSAGAAPSPYSEDVGLRKGALQWERRGAQWEQQRVYAATFC